MPLIPLLFILGLLFSVTPTPDSGAYSTDTITEQQTPLSIPFSEPDTVPDFIEPSVTRDIPELLEEITSTKSFPAPVTVPAKQAPLIPPTIQETPQPKKTEEVVLPPKIVDPAPAPEVLPVEESITDDFALHNLRKALVNIICTSTGTVPSMSGTGVIIDTKGVILTAAHIGQYFLLTEIEKASVSCLIRTGSPARNAYTAKPIFISSSWLKDNPATLLEKRAMGTGQHDFALLAISGSATQTSLSASFPAIPMSKEKLEIGFPVIIGSYGAQFLSNADVIASLYPTLLKETIKDVYTFNRTTVDVISLGGNIAAQLGSSGGAITDSEGSLAALITTSTIEGPILSRDLRAITLRHIRESFSDDTRKNLDTFLSSGNLNALTTAFESDTKQLQKTLLNTLGL